MAFRGRGGGGFGGRGGGFGGRGGLRAAKQVPFELFPDIPDLPDAKSVVEEWALARWGSKFQRFWNSSPYYDDGVGEAAKQKESKEIKRFSDKDSERNKRKPPLSDFIKMTNEYVPAELGEKKERHKQKKVRWNPDSDLQKLDLFEQREQRSQLQDEKGEKEKKEGEEEEEDNENIEEDEEAEMSDDDYNQNIDFDDDEDDFNMPDDNDDEAIL